MGKGRAPCCDKSQVKRGPWSPEEDLRLMAFIQKHGHENWRALPKQAGLLRCGKSCRLRWINYLRPDLKRGGFTKEEEDLIIRLHQSLGNKWSKIASHFPGRTDNEIKNVWNTHFKKKMAALDANTESSSTSSSSSTSNIGALQGHADIVTKLNFQQLDISSTENQDFQQKDHTCDRHLKPTTKKPNGSSNSATSSSSSDTSSTVLTNTSQVDVTKHGEGEVQGTTLEMEIPLESDVEFWNMLDSLTNSDNEIPVVTGNADQESITSNFGDTYLEEIENKRWLSYLKNELGLEETSEGNDLENLLGDSNIGHEIPGDMIHDNLFEPEINSELECYYLWPSI